jgi:hypothetical protein
VLVIPPNTIVLVARAAQQLDHLPAPRWPTMQSARFNLILRGLAAPQPG